MTAAPNIFTFYEAIWLRLERDYGLTYSIIYDRGQNKAAAELMVECRRASLDAATAAFIVANACQSPTDAALSAATQRALERHGLAR